MSMSRSNALLTEIVVRIQKKYKFSNCMIETHIARPAWPTGIRLVKDMQIGMTTGIKIENFGASI